MARLFWTQRSNFGPPARVNPRMAFDSKRERVVLFGGQSDDPNAGVQGILGDTWEWDGSFWTQMNDIGPPVRTLHAMAFETSRAATVVFGGTGEVVALGDTWQWDGQDWTQLLDSGPPGRSAHAMVFDRVRKRIVLFGGAARLGDPLFQDTWEFDGESWTQRDDTGPPARANHGMAFDATSARVILFGGNASGITFGDTWAWDGRTWVQVAEFGPPPRDFVEMTEFDEGTVLFGGNRIGDTGGLFDDTWQFDGKRWTQRQDIGPGARFFHAMAFDSSRKAALLFGGQGAAAASLGDTWELRAG